MSDKCIFQSEQKDIGEARCIIPSELRPKHLEKYCSTGFESWLCEYRGNEDKCPIHDLYITYAREHYEDIDYRAEPYLPVHMKEFIDLFYRDNQAGGGDGGGN